MEPMHQRVAGIDVHRMKHVVTILIGQEDGAVSSETREFGVFKRDMRALVAWPIKMVTTCFIRCTSIPATR